MGAILKDEKSIATPFFVVFKKENGLGENHYAVLVGKKLEKSAVKRNRKRRQIYEIVRLLEKEDLVPKTNSFDIVLLARRPVVKASFDELQSSLKNILKP